MKEIGRGEISRWMKRHVILIPWSTAATSKAAGISKRIKAIYDINKGRNARLSKPFSLAVWTKSRHAKFY